MQKTGKNPLKTCSQFSFSLERQRPNEINAIYLDSFATNGKTLILIYAKAFAVCS